MSFDLRIQFVGLMLFVPEDGKRMHVLMPFHEGHEGHENDGSGGTTPGAHDPDEHGGGTGPVTGEAGSVEHSTQVVSAPGQPAGDPGVVNHSTHGEGGAAHPAGDADGATHPTGDGHGTDDPAGHMEGSADKPSKDRHYARLVWDRAHEDDTSEQMSRRLMFVNIERRVLDMIGLVKEPDLDPDLSNELPHMKRVGGAVERKWIEAFPAGELLSRVTFDAGALTHCENGAPFYLGGEATRMTSRTEWTIRGIEGDSLDLGALITDESGGKPDLPPLYPIGQTITITVYNALAADMPRSGTRGPEAPDDARHFVAYYDLCKHSGERPIPVAVDAEDILVFGDHVKADVNQSGTGLTCVQAQANLAPPSP